jgi:hypothetical protein
VHVEHFHANRVPGDVKVDHHARRHLVRTSSRKSFGRGRNEHRLRQFGEDVEAAQS